MLIYVDEAQAQKATIKEMKERGPGTVAEQKESETEAAFTFRGCVGYLPEADLQTPSLLSKRDT